MENPIYTENINLSAFPDFLTNGLFNFDVDTSGRTGIIEIIFTAVNHDNYPTSIGINLHEDNDPPVLSLAAIESNNSTNTDFAKVGDTVTLYINIADPKSGIMDPPIVVISGQTATVNDLGNNQYTATYVMQAGDTGGIINFTIDYTDAAGNPAAQATATTNGSTVTFHEGPPSLTSVTLTSDNTNPLWAKVVL
jgi:hypothetical protein